VRDERMDLKLLPQKVRYQYEKFQTNKGSWEKTRVGNDAYWRKLLATDSEEYNTMLELYYGYFEAHKKLTPTEVYAIYNPVLLQNFINQRKLMTNRITNSPATFNKAEWKLMGSYRQITFDKYQQRLKLADQSEGNEIVPILPVAHGTDFSLAMAICSTGFATLSSLDAGWYGSGVYFTSYVMYALPYFSNRKDPALIISYVFLGNTYPIVEHAFSGNTLMGKVIKPGYNSHYIMLNADGHVPKSAEEGTQDGYFDEVVIPQETQITPVYVLRFNAPALQKFMHSYDVKTARPRQRGDKKEENDQEPARKKSSAKKKSPSTPPVPITKV